MGIPRSDVVTYIFYKHKLLLLCKSCYNYVEDEFEVVQHWWYQIPDNLTCKLLITQNCSAIKITRFRLHTTIWYQSYSQPLKF